MIWKEYSRKYLKGHRESSVSIMAAVFIFSLFISSITTLFYNMWVDSVRRAAEKDRDWRAGTQPSLLTGFYFVTMCMVYLSMALVSYHVFVMGADEYMHRLGVLQTMETTSGQIRACLLQEVTALSLLPTLAGVVAGAEVVALFLHTANSISRALEMKAAYLMYHPPLFLPSLDICALAVDATDGRVAIQLSRVSPLDAVTGGREKPVRQVRSSHPFSKIRGAEGELARKFLYARGKAFRVSFLFLTLSFMVFSLFLNFWVLSGPSIKYTYFERYKDTQDLMVAVKEKSGGMPLGLLGNIRSLSGVTRCTRHEKTESYTWLKEGMLSEEFGKASGLESLKNTGTQKLDGRYWIRVSVVILGQNSFHEFLEEAESDSSVTEVTVNRVWGNVNSHFWAKAYLPFTSALDHPVAVTVDEGSRVGESGDRRSIQLYIGAYTNQVPDLREEYPDFSLIYIMPEQIYEGKAGNRVPGEVYYQIKAVSDEAVPKPEGNVSRLMGGEVDYELGNRQTEEACEADVRRGYQLIAGSLCGPLVLVGIASAYANTLGGLYMREREFARYLSMEVTPRGLTRILTMEVCIVGIRLILTSIPVNIGFVIFTVRQSRFMSSGHLSVIPLEPLALFGEAVLVFVGMTY